METDLIALQKRLAQLQKENDYLKQDIDRLTSRLNMRNKMLFDLEMEKVNGYKNENSN